MAVCNYLSPKVSDDFIIIVFARQLMSNQYVWKTVLGTIDSKRISVLKWHTI